MMKVKNTKKILSTLFILLLKMIINFPAYGQEKKLSKDVYVAGNIADSLKENSNAVVRYSSDELIVKGPGKAIKRHHSIITILNEKGDDEARVILFYDKKYNSVNSLEMTIYNASGLKLKKYYKSDMYDRSATDETSVITDDRLLVVKHIISAYPTTVELNYETVLNSYLDLGKWNIQDPEKSIEFAEYKVSVNSAIGFRYKNRNINIIPVKSTEEGLDHFIWTVQNLKSVKPEDDALTWQVMPKIFFAANAFQFNGLPGDFSTWQNYGKWYQALNADVCTLMPKRVDEIQKMTADLKNDKDKVHYLYNYMQKNVRYVSIQLGIGGLKPFPASFVDEKHYGDCKALSNYMYALLKAVNIPSYYALIKSGNNVEPADLSFPRDPFDHVILCVPLKNDTTWLECTSSTQSFGKLGPFTENRNALLITEEGGKLVSTPKSNSDDNQFNSEVHLVLNAEGGAKASLKILGTGEYRAQYIGIGSLKNDEQKEYLIRLLNIKQPNLLELSHQIDKDGIKEVDAELDYEKFYDAAIGDKQFYRPRVFDLWRVTVPVLEKRKTDFYFEHPMQKSCVTTIDLPPGFEVETLPANQSLKFTYGNYDVNYTYDVTKNHVMSVAKFKLNSHVIPAVKYNELQVFMDNIAKAQNKKLVIRRKA